MWTRIVGQPSFNGDLFNRCLKLDGANDYLNLPANNFYQLSNNAFSFVIRFQHLSNYTNKSLIRTALTTISPRFLVILGAKLGLYFISKRHLDISPSNQGDIINYDIDSIPIRQWNTMIVQRKGSNNAPSTDTINYPDSIRNPNNIEVWVGGVKLTPTNIVQQFPEGIEWDVNSTENFTIGTRNNEAGTFFDGYLDFFAYYNKSLSNEEISEMTLGRFTDDNAKGIWNFTGNTNDDSSVGNPMNLLNSTTPEYITWPKTSGVFVFKTGIANQVFSRIFPAEVRLTSVYKNQAYSYQYSLNSGSTWQTLPTNSGVDTSIDITIPAGTSFMIRDQTSRPSVGVVHLTF